MNYGPGNGYITTPPNMPNYALGASSSLCWPLDVKEWTPEEALDINVYPNPTSGTLYIRSEHFKTSEYYYELYDAQARVMQSGLFANQEAQYRIDVSALARGNYVMKVFNREIRFEQQIVLK